MSIYIKNNKEATINRKIVEYIKPQIIYIPLESKTGVTYKHFVKEGDYVYKGSVVAINEDIKFPIHSSVSGYVIKGVKKIMNNGKKIKCIVVENDFKEKYEYKIGSKKNINKYSKEDFLELLQKSGITGLGGSDYPTFVKYRQANLKYLIVNGVECEPYITADNAIMRAYSEEILECIDAITEIMGLDKAIIAVKEDNVHVISEFNKYIGSYPNISLFGMMDEYPNGWEKILVKEILDIDYQKYPAEQGVIVENVSTIYAIYEMLKYGRPLTERVITVTGCGVKKPTNIRVKIGASMNEIMYMIDAYKKLKNPLFIAGGTMMGNSMPTDNVVITKNLNGVVVLENDNIIPTECIHCGKCSNICPQKLIPVLIKDNLNNHNKLKDLMPNKCIECGLCSYICPSKIEIREFVKKAKEDIKNGI